MKMREEGLGTAKKELMEASQVFAGMKKLSKRMAGFYSDEMLDSLSRQCVANSLLVFKLEKLKVSGQTDSRKKKWCEWWLRWSTDVFPNWTLKRFDI